MWKGLFFHLIQGNKQAEEASGRSPIDWRIFPLGVIWCKTWHALFCNWHILLHRRGTKPSESALFQLPLAWSRSTSPTQSSDGEKSSSENGNKDAPCWHKMRKRHASYLHDVLETVLVSAKVFDWNAGQIWSVVLKTLGCGLEDFSKVPLCLHK